MKNSNVRNLTKTLAVVSLLAPAAGHALGIGEIKLHSALNQNLDAEISLTLSGESVSDIKVNLAPPEKFDEAGVSWTYFLSKIKFETIAHPNGSTVIKLTSKEALKEPFLDFLLEVSWPKGNLYREFTVLVDPPSVYKQVTVPVLTGTENYAQPPVAATPHANGQSSEDEYGPTLENDTLWSVAERVRGQNDVSVEQMMVAIYEANPHAFYKGNVYALTAGKMLKIPETGVVLKLSRNQALAEFNRHTKAWKNRATSAHAETAKGKPVQTKGEGQIDNQLTLDAPAKTAVDEHAVVTSANEQVSTEKKAADAGSATPGMVKDKTVEGAGKTVPTDGAIESRIAELEKQLAMMKELVALKDQQLAALQNQAQTNHVAPGQVVPNEVVAAKLADQTAPPASAPQQAVVQPKPTQPLPSEVVTAKPDNQTTPAQKQVVVPPAQPVVGLAQSKPGTESLIDPYYMGVGGVGAALLTLLGWLWWRKRKVDEETNTESMFASSSMIKTPEDDENVSVPVVEDGAAAVVNDVGTVGESSFLSEFTPSDFDSFDTDQGEIDPISEADVYLAYGRYQQAEELIRQAIVDQPNRDECKLKLLEIFYANENKTAFEAYSNELAEAGKRNEPEFWEKAAEMGREICPDSPLFSSGDNLFVVADDLIAENVVRDEGGSEERPNSGTSSFGGSVGDDSDNGPTESKDNRLDFDLASPEVKDNSLVDEQRNNADIDFDLSSFSMGAKELDDVEKGVIASSTKEVAFSGGQTEDIDFDLGSFSMGSDGADKGGAVSSEQASVASGMQIEDIDFDLGSFSVDTKETGKGDKGFTPSSISDMASGALELNKKQEFESYEFDSTPAGAESKGIDDFDFNSLVNDGNNQQTIDFSEDMSLELNDDLGGDFDFNFDLDMPATLEDERSSDQNVEFGVSDLTDMDELETKLDLAKAYVDMGDADAAKDIAREVLEQGTAEQKKIAQALLDELD